LNYDFESSAEVVADAGMAVRFTLQTLNIRLIYTISF
jgi:hypothetical protein